MATVKKSKKKLIIIISIVLVIAIAVGAVFGIVKANSGEAVQLASITTGDIYEKVSLTGEVSAGTSKEYKVATVATVKEVFVKVGDTVKQNDVLATFDVSAMDEQIRELRSSYNSARSSYNNAVKSQKTAKSKADALEKEIEKTEKNVKKLEAQTETTRPVTNKPITSPTTKPTEKPSETESTTESTTLSTTESTTDSNPGFGDLTEALENLNETLTSITENMEELTKMTTIIAESLAHLGELDEATIAEMIVKNLVESGVAEDIAKQIVESIDFAALGSAIVSSKNVSLTAAQIQLVALQAQHAIYTAQADGTTVSIQKTAVDATKKALDALENQQKEMADGWKAAFDGTITAVDIYPGEQTTLMTAGITLENLDSMSVKISLGEYDLPKVKVGMAAVVTTAYGTYEAEVASIAPTASGGSGTSILDSVGSMAGISGLSSLTATGAGVDCVISIPKTDEHIIAGFDANVEIHTGEYLGIPVVPTGAIKLEKTGSYVYLYNEDDKTVTKTLIETGAHDDSVYEVKSGIKIGDRIISAPSTTYEEDTFKVKVTDK